VVGGLLFPRSLAEWISHNFDRDLYHGVQFGDLPPLPKLSTPMHLPRTTVDIFI
jgi:hypothetical protein